MKPQKMSACMGPATGSRKIFFCAMPIVKHVLDARERVVGAVLVNAEVQVGGEALDVQREKAGRDDEDEEKDGVLGGHVVTAGCRRSAKKRCATEPGASRVRNKAQYVGRRRETPGSLLETTVSLLRERRIFAPERVRIAQLRDSRRGPTAAPVPTSACNSAAALSSQNVILAEQQPLAHRTHTSAEMNRVPNGTPLFGGSTSS